MKNENGYLYPMRLESLESPDSDEAPDLRMLSVFHVARNTSGARGPWEGKRMTQILRVVIRYLYQQVNGTRDYSSCKAFVSIL